MRERNYGRIVLTTSSRPVGNFGQANYGAAKAGMIGLMNVLAEEGRKNNVPRPIPSRRRRRPDGPKNCCRRRRWR